MGHDGRTGAGRAGARLTQPTQPTRPTQPPPVGVDPAWLRLRGPTDVRARTAYGTGLVDDLADHLSRHSTAGVDGPKAVQLVDVGAGTGAGARWLRDQLTDRLRDKLGGRLADGPADGPAVRQHWRLVDHDPDLLACAAPTADGWARGVVATVDDLRPLLADEPADVVTCQALLDVLTASEVDAMVAPAADSGAAVLLALSVTGEVVLSPSHQDDEMVAEAFDAHQQRAGRLGPDGGAYAAHRLRRRGYAVTMAATPWHLGAADTDLLRAWLEGRADAAREQEPRLAGRVGRWRHTRDQQAARGELNAVVGHVDVLGLPPRPPVSS